MVGLPTTSPTMMISTGKRPVGTDRTMALIAYILRSDSDNDSSLGGISSKALGNSRVVIDNIDQGNDLISQSVLDDLPHVTIHKRVFGSRVSFHAEPAGKDRKDESYGAYMAGGSFIHSSDSRFSAAIGGMYGAIALHDRCEPWDMIARMD